MPELGAALVVLEVDATGYCAEVHWVLNDFPVVGTAVLFRVHWIHEVNSVFDVIFGEIYQLADHRRQRLRPLPLDFVRLLRVDHLEQFSGPQDPVHFRETRIEIHAFHIVGLKLDQFGPLGHRLVEPVQLVFPRLVGFQQLVLGKPFGVEIAPIFELDQVERTLPRILFPPKNLVDVRVENAHGFLFDFLLH